MADATSASSHDYFFDIAARYGALIEQIDITTAPLDWEPDDERWQSAHAVFGKWWDEHRLAGHAKQAAEKIIPAAKPAPTRDDFIKALFAGTDGETYVCSFTNERGAGPERHVIGRSNGKITQFLKNWDKEGRGAFVCVGTLKKGAQSRNKAKIAETPCLHADIDFKDLDTLGEEPVKFVLRQLARLKYPPSIIVLSGGGVHAYWLFKEALDTQTEMERIETALRQLADVVGGDLSVCEVSRVMRVPGSHNTKEHVGRKEVEIVELHPDRRFELDDIEEWLSEQSPVMLRKSREHAKTAGETDDVYKFFEDYAKRLGIKPLIDVDARLKAMIYMGGGNSGIHQTQIECGASMLSSGMAVDDVVEVLMEATRRAAGEYGTRWRWEREKKKIRRDCESWIKKHPEIKAKADRAAAKSAAAQVSSSSTTPTPGMGHNSNGKLPLHVALANSYIAGMQQGYSLQFRRVPDLKGSEHIWRYRDGIWSLQSDKDAARSLHPLLQRIVNDLGRENKSSTKLFNEATAHILRSGEVCRHDPVMFNAHSKVPTLTGLVDPLTHAMEPFKPEDYATWRLPVAYDANATCPHWEQALNDAFADMTEADRKTTVELVQELIGMALIDNKPKALSRAMVLFGGTDTGKTVTLKVTTALFGGAITTTFGKLDGNHGLQRFVDRLPWVLGEAFNQSGWYVSDMVKSIITGDPVEINGKGIPAISMKVNAPAFWATNHPPKFKESSGAMATRMVIIPMTRTFDKSKPVGVAAEARKHNPAWEPFDLIINTELSGVLTWALVGLKRALERGHFVNTNAGLDLLEQSRKESNVVAAFLDECVTYDLTVMMSTTDFYAAFKEWFISENGEKAAVPSPTHVGLELAALPNSRIAQNKDRFKLAAGRFYLGCYLNSAGEGFWQDATNAARLLKPNSPLVQQDSPRKEPVPKDWKKIDAYRRIEANTERVKDQQPAVRQAARSVDAEPAPTPAAPATASPAPAPAAPAAPAPTPAPAAPATASPATAATAALSAAAAPAARAHAHDDGLDIPEFLRRTGT
jgi:P4 family phage/plasmid primase-like protien